jgi:endopolyphosphatase
MEYVAQNFARDIDFVIWTGDSARHDNDDKYPRTEDQVLGLNRFMVEKMAEVFGKHNGDQEDSDPNNDFVIPIVPNLGNNDILPHNILSKGPNTWTRAYSQLWRQFIPESQQHSFQQGGWYYVEVIPHKLAVFSLNTMYFFDSNAAADGCSVRSEPGFQQMEWLRIQLQFMRDRGMKAILIGHVPPVRQEAKTSWDETCWQKYTLWTRQFRDVIVSSHYGHFNYDHFMLQDFRQLKKGTKKGRMHASAMKSSNEEDDISPLVKTDYFIQLRNEWSGLPSPPTRAKTSWLDTVLGGKKKKSAKKEFKKAQRKYLRKIGGKHAERFSASFVGASVVPNLFPTMRVFEYNISNLDLMNTLGAIPPPAPFEFDNSDVEVARKKKKKHHKKKYKFVVPDPPAKDAGPGPAYAMQPLSLLKYTQYFANLTFINNDFANHSAEAIVKSQASDDSVEDKKWNEGKHKGKKPHDIGHTPDPKEFKYEMLYDTRDDDVYRLKDLTMPSLLGLARRIGDFVPEEDADSFELERGEENEEMEDDESEEADVDAEGGKKHKKRKGKKGKHGKGKKKKHQHEKQNEAWYTFVRRAYVETMRPEEIEEEFGR